MLTELMNGLSDAIIIYYTERNETLFQTPGGIHLIQKEHTGNNEKILCLSYKEGREWLKNARLTQIDIIYRK